jgi:NADPH:quinone reductase-like Zn-dependent oxidoreductase
MRAAVLHAHGAVPEVGEFRDPVAEPGAVVLDVLAGAVNPVDVRIASGAYPLERFQPPYVVGKEGVGRRADGSLVYFDMRVPPYGSFAERTLISDDHGYPVPSGLDPALAVCLGVSGLAAWLGLEWRGRLAAGETVLVLGASGVVGLIAVQAARLLGAGRVVAAARDAAALERAGSLGADALVPLEGEELTAALVSASGGDGYDLVLDPLWGEPALAAMGAVKRFGRHVQLGQSAGAEVSVPSAAVRNKPIDLIGHTNFAASEERKAAAYERMAAHALAGELRVPIERLGLDDVPDAWARVGSSPHAKLVIVP